MMKFNNGRLMVKRELGSTNEVQQSWVHIKIAKGQQQ